MRASQIALMRRERTERGFVSVSGIFSLLILVVLVFLGFKLLPPYVSNFQLEDTIQNIALTATYAPMTNEEIMKAVIARARGFGVELTPKQITANKSQRGVVIAVDYTTTVDLFVRSVDLHFSPSAANQSFSATTP